MRGICAAVPVPLSTTFTIMSCSAAAVWGFMTRASFFGRVRATSFPPGPRISFTTCGRLERRDRVEAELLGLVEDPCGAELLADLAVDRVDRVDEREEEVDVTELLRRLRIACVRDLLAVLVAVAGVVELRVGRVDPGVERGRRRHDLEGRPRWVETLRRAVEERRHACARRRSRAQDPRVPVRLLDQVRVV